MAGAEDVSAIYRLYDFGCMQQRSNMRFLHPGKLQKFGANVWDPTSAAGQSHFVYAVPVFEPLALAGHHAQTADVVVDALVRLAGGKIGAGR